MFHSFVIVFAPDYYRNRSKIEQDYSISDVNFYKNYSFKIKQSSIKYCYCLLCIQICYKIIMTVQQ